MTDVRTCAVCGKELTRREGETNQNFRNRKTCSDECRRVLATHTRGPSTKVERICKRCGNRFRVHQSELARDRSGGLYCSRKCYFDIPRTEFVCETCHRTYGLTQAQLAKKHREGVQPRFCSRKCWITYKQQTDIQIECAECGKVRTLKGNRAGQRFCSNECLRKAEARKWQRQRAIKPCETCGRPTEYRPYQINHQNRFFCSNQCMSRAVGDWAISTGFKDGVREDVGFYVRSSWEANIVRFFRFMHISFEYEPQRFRLLDSWYTPDFKIEGCWIEVKGQMRSDAQRKIAEFRKIYPEELLIILDKPLYAQIEKEFADRIPEWEPTYIKRRQKLVN